MSDEINKVQFEGWTFTRVPNAPIEDTSLSTVQRMVFVALCYHADKAGKSFPSYNRIAKLVGCSRRAAIAAIEKLVTLGYVTKTYTKGEHANNSSNIYTVRTYQRGASKSPPSESGAPGVVNDVHHPSESGAPEREPSNENQLNESGSVRTSKPKATKKVSIEYDGYSIPVGKKRMNKIIADFGEHTFYRYLDRILLYCESKNKWPYKDYAATMWNWIQDDIAKGKGPVKRQQETKPKINVHELGGGYD